VHSTLVDYVSPRSAEPVVLLHKEKDIQQIQASAPPSVGVAPAGSVAGVSPTAQRAGHASCLAHEKGTQRPEARR